MLLVTGGGTRSRHIYAIGLETGHAHRHYRKVWQLYL